MAFHVACPLTCRPVCDCELGFPPALRGEKAREALWADVEALQDFLADPWLVREADAGAGDGAATVRVWVPVVEAQDDDGEEARRAEMQRRAVAAEDYVRKLEAGAAGAVAGEESYSLGQSDQGISGSKVMCRICFSGEDEGSLKASKMLACKFCSKKYHKGCLKSWGQHRDLFHWTSWACPSCRVCEVCRKSGDPNKLMFCRRCDGAYHCYCQQPPHKNVGHGPYLCPKHTRCHSCGSNVPGSGHSTRWFLGYTCCDACGRLFVKGNYCPVCLKVYRDSEVIPMVCCDICEKWVHIECDDISEEKYQQYQSDQNLQYTCAACRGECYQVKDTEDAVRELWKRRDLTDHELITSLRAAAGLPSAEEASSASQSDEELLVGAIEVKNDAKKTLKFSFKSSGADKPSSSLEQDKNLSKNTPSSKKSSKKKASQNNSVDDQDDQDVAKKTMNGNEGLSRSRAQNPDDRDTEMKRVVPPKGFTNNNVNMIPKVKIKSSQLPSLQLKEAGESLDNNESKRGTKLVIHLGSRHKTPGSPTSENSSCQRENEHVSPTVARFDRTSQPRSSRHDMKDNSILKEERLQKNGNLLEELAPSRGHATGKRSATVNPAAETSKESGKTNKAPGSKQPKNVISRQRECERAPQQPLALDQPLASSNLLNDQKPVLKLKFKKPYLEQQSSWSLPLEEMSVVKGQRSKRKRPPPVDKPGMSLDGDSATWQQRQSPMDEAMDANWILRKLGKDAIGKRVEVCLSSDSLWHAGVVSKAVHGSSSLSVRLDDGRTETFDLGKQGIRFVSHRQKGVN